MDMQSLVAIVRSFVEVSYHALVMEKFYQEAEGGSDKTPYVSAISVEAIVASNLELLVLNVGTLYFSLISITVSLVGPSMSLFRSLIETSLVLVVILSRVVVSL